MKCKLLSIVLVAILMLSLFVPTAMAEDYYSPFSDVSPNDYFYNPVLWAVGGDVTQGVGDGKFAPYTICTRGQVVTFLWRAMGQPEPNTKTNPFTDVNENNYFYKPVLWAVEQGITNGTTASAFSPDQTCSCAHIITFLWRSMEAPEPGAPSTVSARFPDGWYSGAVSWAEYQGLLSGFEDAFDINEPCSRALTVTYLFRALVYNQAQWGGEWDPTVIQRQVLFDEDVLCGAVLVGVFGDQRGQNEMINDMDYWRQVIEDSGLTEDFEFLRELPAGQIVQTGGGRELYLIIPTDRFASVTVNKWIMNESNGWVGETGEVLYKSDTGKPFILCCNWVDSYPDAQVIIVDSNGRVLDWKPQLSMMDGHMVTVSNGMYIYDFTNYPGDGGVG
ncbi:MAG: S-layer homology domain-containing protein [Clostridia bacterium]|nr:S-layer homology domain-containing protein [Clostridia bacterium]